MRCALEQGPPAQQIPLLRPRLARAQVCTNGARCLYTAACLKPCMRCCHVPSYQVQRGAVANATAIALAMDVLLRKDGSKVVLGGVALRAGAATAARQPRPTAARPCASTAAPRAAPTRATAPCRAEQRLIRLLMSHACWVRQGMRCKPSDKNEPSVAVHALCGSLSGKSPGMVIN